MKSEREKPPETPNAPYRASGIKHEMWRSEGPGFEPGREGPHRSIHATQGESIDAS
jgi:hypothetical protein